MFRPEFNDLLCVSECVTGRFSRDRENQIKAYVFKALLPCQPEITFHISGGVYPTHEMEPVVVHRLDAHRKPVDPHRSVSCELSSGNGVLPAERAGIGFKRYLCIRSQIIILTDSLHDP